MTAPRAEQDARLEPARRLLVERFGHADFRPGQRLALDRILGGESLIVVMPTGAGKSACFQVPALLRSDLTLVISPLIALMKDQVEGLRARGLPADFVNSTLTADEQRQRLDLAARGETRLLYVAPERLGAPSFLRAMERARVGLVAVDEAHCISQWGHDFRPAYLRIRTFLERLGEAGTGPQVLALTATATPRVRSDVAQQLGLDPEGALVTGFRRDNLRLLARRRDRKAGRLAQVLEVVRGVAGSGIVYCATRRAVEEVTAALTLEGVSAVGYHAGMADEERSAVQEDFLGDRARIIVATNAFGMGVDKPDIRCVVHHSLPGSIEAYYQEAGRAGRDGRVAYCVLVHGSADRHLHEFFVDGASPPAEVVLATWSALRGLGEGVIERTAAELAAAAGVPENQCAGSLRVLEDGGLVERLDDRDNPAQVRLLAPVRETLACLRSGTQAARFVEWVGERLSPSAGEVVAVRPSLVQADLGLARASWTRVLGELSEAGLAETRLPFRGKGLVVRSPGLPTRAAAERLAPHLEALAARRARALERIDRIAHYAHARRCRHRFLLEYFGDDAPETCRACDTCCGWDDPGPADAGRTGGRRARADAGGRVTEPALDELRPVLLEAVALLDRRFGLGVVTQVLRGSRARKVLRSGLDDLAVHGRLANVPKNLVEGALSRLQADGLIETTPGPYPVVGLTEAGRLEHELRGPA